MNHLDGRISPRLIYIAGTFFCIVVLTFFIWPRSKPKAAPPPPKPMPKITKVPMPFEPQVMPMATPTPQQVQVIQQQAIPTPAPTPCQPCLEVLSRYIHAIRTGAGKNDENR